MQLPGEHGLAAALAGAMEVVHSLLLHSPDTWSGRVLQVALERALQFTAVSEGVMCVMQWTVDVFARVCNSRGAPQGLEEALRHWLGHSSELAHTSYHLGNPQL